MDENPIVCAAKYLVSWIVGLIVAGNLLQQVLEIDVR
jgi:hypothetical protein